MLQRSQVVHRLGTDAPTKEVTDNNTSNNDNTNNQEEDHCRFIRQFHDGMGARIWTDDGEYSQCTVVRGQARKKGYIKATVRAWPLRPLFP